MTLLSRRRLTALFWLALWLSSLTLPVAYLPGDRWMGWGVLLTGFLGLLFGQFGWFANLGFLASFGLMLGTRRPNSADLVAATLSLAAVGDALFWRKVYSDDGSSTVQALGAGYYLWLVAIVGLAASVFWVRFSQVPASEP